MNKVILMGRLTADPTTKNYDDGGQTTSYKLAVNRPYKNKDGIYEADFILCQCTGDRGKFVEKWFTKGMMVAVVGSLRTKSWKDKDGTWNNMTWVDTVEHYFTGSKSDNSEKADEMPVTNEPVKGQTKMNAETKDDEDDELPF